MRELTVDEGEMLILSIVRKKTGRMTTWELDSEIRSTDSGCPDEIVVFLARMRQKGMIRGEISQERRGWVWWLGNE
jgi:hypothetical protein